MLPGIMHETESKGHQKTKVGSPGSEVVSLKQFLEESNKLTLTQIQSASQENLLDEVIKSLSHSAELMGRDMPKKSSTLSGKSFCDKTSTKPEQLIKSSLLKTDGNCIPDTPLKSTSSTPGKFNLEEEKLEAIQPQRQSKDHNPYATLPRASSVISTAEGCTRRTSIHDFLSKDSRQPVSIDPSPTTADTSIPSTSSEYCVDQQSSPFFACTTYSADSPLKKDAGHTGDPEYKSLQFNSPKTGRPHFSGAASPCPSYSDLVGISSSNKIVSYTAPHMSQPFLSMNTELVSNISGLPQKSASNIYDKGCIAPFKGIRKDHEIFSDSQMSDDINVKQTLSGNECSAAPLNISASESLLQVSEDNQSVWYEYGCV